MSAVIKGIVHPKMKFCQHLLQVVSNLYEFWRIWVTKKLVGPIDFHSMGEINTMEVNEAHQLFGYKNS